MCFDCFPCEYIGDCFRDSSPGGRLCLFIILVVGIPCLVILTVLLLEIGSIVITAAATVCMLMYFTLRVIQFCTCDDRHQKLMNKVAIFSFGGFLVVTLCGWDVMLIHAQIDQSLKHYLILGLETETWIELLLIFSALGTTLMLTHAFIASIWEYNDLDPSDISIEGNHMSSFIEEIGRVLKWGVFLLVELTLTRYFPNWKPPHSLILGFEAWKFIQVLGFMFLGTDVIKMTVIGVLIFLRVSYFHQKHASYYVEGLRKSVSFACISAFWMVMWLSYIRPHFLANDTALDFVSWSLIWVSIGSIFWVIKRLIVLWWTDHVVYNKFQEKITQPAIQFYFLRILSSEAKAFTRSGGGGPLDKEWLRVLTNYVRGRPSDSITTNTSTSSQENQQEQGNLMERLKHASFPTYALQQMALVFQDIGASSQKIIMDISSQFPSNAEVNDSEGLQRAIRMRLNPRDAADLYNLIEQVDPSNKGINSTKFKKWVVRAYRNCSELGDTILGAKEVASYLDKVLTGIFFTPIIIVWLIVTKIATLNILILITSPLLATKFIFGDSSKNIFQGIILALVLPIFNVGDTCVIEDTQMKVKRIGIWETTFIKVGTKEKVVYQNSSLGNKAIIKHKAESSDLGDSVDYRIPKDRWNASNFINLKARVKKYLDKNALEYKMHPLGVVVEEFGQNYVKIAIHFKHAGLQDMIDSECRKRQSTNRANLLLQVKNILNS